MGRAVRTMGAIAVICLLAPVQALATYPGLNGKIAFEHGSDVWTMDPDGSNQASLVPGFQPAWSSDGRKLAWVCSTPGSICTANADGTNQTPVGNGGRDRGPTWSPDGAFLAFGVFPFCEHGFCSGPAEVWRMDADGSDRLFFRDGFRPDWSPDGASILYDAPVGDFAQIWLVASNNSGASQLTTGPAHNFEPSWSPDGKIAFTSLRDGDYEIYTMNQDGSAQTRLTTNAATDESPDWSPDGEKIAFASNRDGNYEIYTMNADGSGVTRLTNDPAFDAEPDWQTIRANPPRPKGATPLRASLVPAFRQCTAPDRQHGAPLSFGSCASPALIAGFGTLGSSSIGSVRLDVVAGSQNPYVQADVKVAVSLTDVRRGFDLADLPGDLDLPLPVRITDNDNGGQHITPATVTDFNYFNNPFHFTVPCTETADTTIGSTCSMRTSVNALVPPSQGGAYLSGGDRSIWELGQIAVYDGGEDGYVRSLDDNTPLAVQGVFVP
jgi:WD40-like Beta Propeller Repeat